MKNAISKINVKSIWTEKMLFFLIKVLMVFAFTTSRNKGAVYNNIALDNKNAWKSLDCGMVARPCTTETNVKLSQV